MTANFPTEHAAILDRLKKIKPKEYGANRNFIDGDVTYLSPYISRGVISTKQVFNHCVEAGFDLNSIEKFIQELAWRDYWQRIWQEKNIDINLKNEQIGADHKAFPMSVLNAKTGITAIDEALMSFSKTGYLHNHLRMYIASIVTNIGRANWELPAKWMYYHLLDGDWASNALSWQWVCGANSNKKYYANQENINRYCKSAQLHTFLDTTYENLTQLTVPDSLRETKVLDLKTNLPKTIELNLSQTKTALYTWHNLDPMWRRDQEMNRLLILEPSHFEKYPIGDLSMEFMLNLAKNIPNIQLFVGEFSELRERFPSMDFVYKEHPTQLHFAGTEDSRDWLSSVKGYYPSFFGFWKKVRKELYA